MLRHMTNTVRLDDALLARARDEAARRGITLTALIEHGLLLAMRQPMTARDNERIELPECHAGGGTAPGVNLDDSANLLDRMERSG